MFTSIQLTDHYQASHRSLPNDPLQWQETTFKERLLLLVKIKGKLPDCPDFQPDQIRLQTAKLDFYQASGTNAYKLSHLTENAPNQYLFFANDKEIHWHDYTNQAIYNINATTGIHFDSPEMMMAYAKFFFHYVRGQLGRFVVVENANEVPWLASATDIDKLKLTNLVEPIIYQGKKADGREYLTATVIFKTALFKTDIAIALTEMPIQRQDDYTIYEETHCPGQLELLNEELLVEDLPITDNPYRDDLVIPMLTQE